MSYLGTLTTPQLAEIRQLILSIIDEGDPWLFYDSNEDFANAQRLDFCDEIQRRLIERSAKALTAGGVIHHNGREA